MNEKKEEFFENLVRYFQQIANYDGVDELKKIYKRLEPEIEKLEKQEQEDERKIVYDTIIDDFSTYVNNTPLKELQKKDLKLRGKSSANVHKISLIEIIENLPRGN